jgi:hypothetical protein
MRIAFATHVRAERMVKARTACADAFAVINLSSKTESMKKGSTTGKGTARLAGLFYLLQIPLGMFGILYVNKNLSIKGNTETTILNILNHEFLFRLSIVSAILAALVTVLTALWLYKVLGPVNRAQAKYMVLFTLIAAPITIINELNHVVVLLISGNISSSLMHHQDLVPLFLDLHTYGIHISGFFWGLWLIPMGLLVIKSEFIPKIIGYFLLAGGLGYLIDFLLFFLSPGSRIVVSEYTFIGEVLMVFWLLLKGVNEKKYDEHSVGTRQL